MAENSATTPALNTQIESGHFDEKETKPVSEKPTKAKVEEGDEEDEDIDALIEDLESHDGHGDDDEEEEATPGGGRVVPEDMLMTDTRIGTLQQASRSLATTPTNLFPINRFDWARSHHPSPEVSLSHRTATDNRKTLTRIQDMVSTKWRKRRRTWFSSSSHTSLVPFSLSWR